MMASDDEARAILDAHASGLTQLPGVVGAGVVSAGSGGCEIAIYVSYNAAALSASVPTTLATTLNGHSVTASTRIINVGDIVR